MNNPTSRKYFVFYLFYVIILGIILTFSESYAGFVKDPNFCQKYVEGRFTYFCCFNYYYKDGLCHECENGTTTEDGIECRSCNEHFYGHKCKYQCMCESDQRCDPVSGCLDETTTFSKIEMSSFFQSQNDSKLAKTSEANSILTTTAAETSENGTEFDILDLMLVASGIIIALLILCWVCSRFCYHRQLLPICHGQEFRTDCKQARGIDDTTVYQNRSGKLRLQIQSQRIVYDYFDDISEIFANQQNI